MAMILHEGPLVPVEPAYRDVMAFDWQHPAPSPVVVDCGLCLDHPSPDYYSRDGDPIYVKPTPGGIILQGPGGRYLSPSPQMPAGGPGPIQPVGTMIGPPGMVDMPPGFQVAEQVAAMQVAPTAQAGAGWRWVGVLGLLAGALGLTAWGGRRGGR